MNLFSRTRILKAAAVAAFIFCLSLFAIAQGDNNTRSAAPGDVFDLKLNGTTAEGFSFDAKEGEIIRIEWPSEGDDAPFFYGVYDDSGAVINEAGSFGSGTYFFVPRSGKYYARFVLDTGYENPPSTSAKIKYVGPITLPTSTKIKDKRRVGGYDVEILMIPEGEDGDGDQFLVVKKNGKIELLVPGGAGSPVMGYSFPDVVNKDWVEPTADVTRSAQLIRSTPDKTGNGVPDVMVDYYSGGAHCCFTTYFIDLADKPQLAQVIDTENSGMIAIGRNPKGGLRFASADNRFAYWNTSFAGSPMPGVVIDFEDGKARINFDLMKKAAPTAAVLARKAAAARKEIDNKPYTGEWGELGDAFWGEMLDLIYTGHEDLAWKYFEMVWPKAKPGKEKFVADFKEQLATSYYANRTLPKMGSDLSIPAKLRSVLRSK